MRRDLFNAMGGFPAIPLMEDVALMRTIVRAGGRVVILPLRATTSARRWRAEGILKTTARNLALITLYSLGVAPARLARLYPAMPDLARRGRG